MAESDLSVGQGMAHIAAIALLQERSMRESLGVIEPLQTALNSRVVIEQAKGMLAERREHDVDPGVRATARLRAAAQPPAQRRRADSSTALWTPPRSAFPASTPPPPSAR